MNSEVAKTLQDLVRFDTTNPPGNEIACAAYVHDRLAAEGIPSTVVEPAPGRGSVIGRLEGDGSEPPLLLLSHLDVVPAEAENWSHPPFAAEIAEGRVWGRGALDCKGLTAIELELLLELKHEGRTLKRDVILAATADEEAGGGWGVRWLTENRFDLIDAQYAINEGGGVSLALGDRMAFVCQTAEKGVCWVKASAYGTPGHASTPSGETALGRLAAGIGRLAAANLPQHRVATVEAEIRGLSEVVPPALQQTILGLLNPETAPDILALLPDKTLAATLRASLHNTATPTVLRAGNKINVIPSLAESEVDCRILPGQTTDDLIGELRTILGEGIEIEILRTWPGTESAYDTPLFEIIGQVMRQFEPNSATVPFMMTGATDGRFLAQKGVKVYGFHPIRTAAGERSMFEVAHGHDEYISLDNLRFGMDVLREVIRRLCARE